jgi:hypothetical protein
MAVTASRVRDTNYPQAHLPHVLGKLRKKCDKRFALENSQNCGTRQT